MIDLIKLTLRHGGILMTAKEYIKRYAIFIIGLFINPFGVSFVTKANLGTSPISSIPYTLSIGFEPTLGMFTLFMSIILIFIQMLLLGKNFPKQYYLQIPVSFAFSWFIDLTMNMLEFLNPNTYFLKFFLLILGCAILGFGVYLEVLADVTMLPGESFVKAVCVTFKKDFGKTKVVFDLAMTLIAAVSGLILFKRFEGVREGTFIAAMLVGMIARFLKRKLVFIERFLYNKVKVIKEEKGLDSFEEA